MITPEQLAKREAEEKVLAENRRKRIEEEQKTELDHPDRIYGFIHGNNLYVRGYYVGLANGVPCYAEKGDGTTWAAWDVHFYPDDPNRYVNQTATDARTHNNP